MSSKVILIFVTFPNKEEAKKLAQHLLTKRLAACISMFPITSLYRWEGKQVEENEIEMIIKTKKDQYVRIKEEIETLHSYQTPQIITVEAAEINEKYHRWVKSEVK